MFLYRFEPRISWAPKNFELTQWLRKYFDDNALFVYRNMDEGVWVIAQAQYDRPGYVEDILTLGVCEFPMMMALNREKLRKVDYILNGPPVDPCKILRQLEADRRRELQEDSDHELSIRRWMGKKIPYFQDNPLYKL